MNQFPESPCQDGRGDSEAFFEFLESGRSLDGMEQNQQTPPVPDLVDAAGDGAFRLIETLTLHGAAGEAETPVWRMSEIE